MAYSDPQSVTINAVAISTPRTSTGLNSSEYKSADGNTKLVISHQYGRRNRRAIRLQVKKIVVDPLITSANVEVSSSITLVVDAPLAGYTAAELKLVVDGFISYLSAGTGTANTINKLLGGEN